MGIPASNSRHGKFPRPASARVNAYLNNELERLRHEKNAKLPSVRKIAAHLRVSTATVYHVFKEFSRDGKIVSGSGRQGTLAVNPQTGKSKSQSLSIGLCTGLAEPLDKSKGSERDKMLQVASWRNRLGQAFLSASGYSDRRVMLHSLTINPSVGDAKYDDLLEAHDAVDGLIMIPHPDADKRAWNRVKQYYEDEGKPVVFIHPPALTETRNFVSVDFLGACSVLARSWYQEGRREILHLLSGNLHLLATPPSRYMGLLYGVSEAGGNASKVVSYAMCADASIESAYTVIKAMVSGRGRVPDAIFSGDYQCLGAIKALEQAGCSIPGCTSVVGYTGIDLRGTSHPEMTRFIQPFDRIAGEALRMLIHRIENDATDMPGIYLNNSFYAGDTTTSQTNDELSAAGVFQ